MKFNISQNPQYSDRPAIPGKVRLMQSVTPLRDTFEQVEADFAESADAMNELFSRFQVEAMKLLPTEFKAVDAKLAELSAERDTIQRKLAASKIDLGDELDALKAAVSAQNAIYGRSEDADTIAVTGNAKHIEACRRLFTELGRTADAKALADALQEIAVPGCITRLAEIAELERVLKNETRRAMFDFLSSVGRVCCPSLAGAQNPAAAFTVEVSHD